MEFTSHTRSPGLERWLGVSRTCYTSLGTKLQIPSAHINIQAWWQTLILTALGGRDRRMPAIQWPFSIANLCTLYSIKKLMSKAR